MELKMEQIIKALECCVTQGVACRDCPHKYDARGARCYAYLKQDALALIRELTEENERLRDSLTETEIPFEQALDRVKRLERKIESLKADTVREMQERFSMILDVGEEIATDRAVDFLDAIAKELLEEAK